jgi:protoporphyrinogen oxidase
MTGRMRVAVIGAGPAGLTAAYALARRGVAVEVFEASAHVGGMARSFTLWGHGVDLGPHRFFSKDARVNGLWLEVIGDDYRMVERRTRILYRNRLFDYPLKLGNALTNMGAVNAVSCLLSYGRARLAERPAPETFEDWVVSRFGRRLFEMFFKSYSEKLWGIPCSELNADFAAQRIQGFSLGQAVMSMFGLGAKRPRTLADAFAYPKAGNGELYERMARSVAAHGGQINLQRPVDRVVTQDGRAIGLILKDGAVIACDHVISSMPLTQMVRSLPDIPDGVREAAARLAFRNTIIVYLLVDRSDLFEDQWLYVHSPELLVGRVTNFRNWVPELNGALTSTVLALEFWCNDDDALWVEDDAALILRARSEIVRAGLVAASDVVDAKVIRVPRCYPVYGRFYREPLGEVVAYLRGIVNLWPIGRYGSFKYNNQDHSILMGLLAADNVSSGAGHDLWAVNSDDSYQEETIITAQGLVSVGPSAGS